MEIYARHGFTDFVLAAGFKADLIETFAATLPRDWKVEVRDTGEATNTGGRVAQCAPDLGSTFFATYADGLGDVDLHRLVAYHGSHPGAATMTTVPLQSQYGTVDTTPEGRVDRFREKPLLPDYWINAGFFVFDERAQEWFGQEDLEREVLPALGSANELYAFRHRGFWRSMDTYKDALELSALSAKGPPPWAGAAALRSMEPS